MHIEGTPEEIHQLLTLMQAGHVSVPMASQVTITKMGDVSQETVSVAPSPITEVTAQRILDEGVPSAVAVRLAPTVEKPEAPHTPDVIVETAEAIFDDEPSPPVVVVESSPEFDKAAVHAVGEVAILTAQPALVLAVLMAYDGDPRMTVGRLYEAVRHEPIKSTQANLREVRAALIEQELIVTKGKRSPHNVTPKGRALIASLSGDEAPLPTATALTVAEAPPADDGLVFLDDAAPAEQTPAEIAQAALAAPPATPPVAKVTIEEMRASLGKLITKLGVKARPTIGGLLKQFGVDDIVSLPKEAWDNFNAAVLDVLATEAA